MRDKYVGLLNDALRLLGLAAILGVSSARAEGERLRFDIKAGAFIEAIFEFYHQSHIEIVYDAATPDFEKIRTHEVIGELEPKEALEQMLQGTGLRYSIDADGSVFITREPDADSTPGPERPPHLVAFEIPTPQDPGKLEQVVVTGSLLHGVLDVIAPLIYISNWELNASHGTVQDALYTLADQLLERTA